MNRGEDLVVKLKNLSFLKGFRSIFLCVLGAGIEPARL